MVNVYSPGSCADNGALDEPRSPSDDLSAPIVHACSAELPPAAFRFPRGKKFSVRKLFAYNSTDLARRTVAFLSGGPDSPLTLPDHLQLTAVVDEEAGLAGALGPISAGRADTLFVLRLRSLAGSFDELTRLLDWLQAAGADLVAADVGLDTATTQGRRTLALLREIDRWSQEPQRQPRRRGRPGLAARAPHVAERIAELRGRGLSLQAIADALNAEGVPTPRGGARWRPSSVQSTLGYRRPRPPAPSEPTLPPPPGR